MVGAVYGRVRTTAPIPSQYNAGAASGMTSHLVKGGRKRYGWFRTRSAKKGWAPTTLEEHQAMALHGVQYFTQAPRPKVVDRF